jgi:hypothetical protein
MTHAARTLAVIVLCAMLAACASSPRATQHATQADTALDETELAAMQADGTGGATGLAVPVGKWLGLTILQMFQNVKLKNYLRSDIYAN